MPQTPKSTAHRPQGRGAAQPGASKPAASRPIGKSDAAKAGKPKTGTLTAGAAKTATTRSATARTATTKTGPSKTGPSKTGKSKTGKSTGPAARPALPERGVHDLGGLPAGAIDRSQHPLTPFDERVDALMMLLGGTHGIFKTDAVRRAIEAYNDEDYQHLAYYQKWLRALRVVLVEQSVLTDAEIEARIAALRAGAGAAA